MTSLVLCLNPGKKIQFSWPRAKCKCVVESTGQGAGPAYLVPNFPAPTEGRTRNVIASLTGQALKGGHFHSDQRRGQIGMLLSCFKSSCVQANAQPIGDCSRSCGQLRVSKGFSLPWFKERNISQNLLDSFALCVQTIKAHCYSHGPAVTWEVHDAQRWHQHRLSLPSTPAAQLCAHNTHTHTQDRGRTWGGCSVSPTSTSTCAQSFGSQWRIWLF